MPLSTPPVDHRFLRVREALATGAVTPGADPASAGRPFPGPPGTMHAAVALVLREARDLDILLIKRARSDRDPWSGHMAFPGGRTSTADDSLLQTAVRETEEETGIRLNPRDLFLGSLAPESPSTPRLPPLHIAPFVFAVEPQVSIVPDPREVESALWVPIQQLFEPGVRTVVDIPLPDGPRPFPAFVLGEHVVWGLTYRILDRFLSLTEG